MTMQAYQFVESQKRRSCARSPVPEPGPGQVLVKIGGAGACHSDLHLMEAPPDRAAGAPVHARPRERGLGREAGAGRDRVRSRATRCWSTARGAAAAARTAGWAWRTTARTTAALGGGGLDGSDGGMAPYLLVPSTRFLIPLGKLDPREAAPLTDAALTSYHAIKRSLHLLGAGSTAVVIGAGGLGQMAIQILHALSAATTVVALDTAEAKLDTAKRMGADETLISGDEAVTAHQGHHARAGRAARARHGRHRPDPADGRAGRPRARPPDDRRPRRRRRAGQLLQPAARVLRRSRPTGARSPS